MLRLELFKNLFEWLVSMILFFCVYPVCVCYLECDFFKYLPQINN